MLHEVLLALWGCKTSIDQILHSSSDVAEKYLHPGDRALLSEIMKIVKRCNTVRDFIKKHSAIDSESEVMDASPDLAKGLYLRALCDGMDEALEPFRNEIVELEDVILNNAYTPLSQIFCRIQKHNSLFAILNSIIREITTQKLHGCKILQSLHRHMDTGIVEVKTALEKMIFCVHVVFYKQLTNWLLYGHLQDIYNEFFIQKVVNTESRVTENADSTAGNGSTEKIAEKNQSLSKTVDNNMWDYEIKVDALPSYIGIPLATKILTIGQSIIMFSNDPRQKKELTTSRSPEDSIWGDREYEYFRKLQNLQMSATLNIIEFELTIDEFKQCVTELLWKVAVEEAQLSQQLKMIKDFYLMGRGDLFREFIRFSGHMLNATPTKHTSRDVNLAFQMALRKIHVGDESAMDSFTFDVPVPTVQNFSADTDAQESERSAEIFTGDSIDSRGWGLLVFKYKIIWPLHLLFNPEAIKDYNTIFRFLLRVKKTQVGLWNLWNEQKRNNNIEIDLLQLRNNLIFIIDNLQYYLQVDVIESQYAIMEISMKSTKNFEDVQRAHSIFLANIKSQTFLSEMLGSSKNSVNKLIRLLLNLCDDFIREASVWEIGNLLITEKEELKTFTATLHSLMEWLRNTLNRVRTQPSGEHLSQLLLRLDYNLWFSKNM